jgi:hypothetical protein
VKSWNHLDDHITNASGERGPLHQSRRKGVGGLLIVLLRFGDSILGFLAPVFPIWIFMRVGSFLTRPVPKDGSRLVTSLREQVMQPFRSIIGSTWASQV